MKHIISASLLLLSCVYLNATPVHIAAHHRPGSVVEYEMSPAYVKMADEILSYVNAYRQKKGLPPLVMNDVMNAQAQKHSENMAAHRTGFGHSGFQNRTKSISSQIKGVNATAENVAYGTLDAKEVVDNWLQSPGHRQNIEGHYNLTGIGIAADKQGALYFTQIFAAN